LVSSGNPWSGQAGKLLQNVVEGAFSSTLGRKCALLGAGVLLVPSQVSRNIRVSVETKYTPERSQTARGVYSFQYNIQIKNEGSKTVQLISRHWVITDAHGEIEEVRGPGVVGKQPILRPGESFEYVSRCPLRTPFGSMYGSYQMTSSDGEEFDVDIPAFALRDPKNMQ
jgi:ApaG protein